MPINILAAGTHSDDGFFPFVVPDFHMLGAGGVLEAVLFEVLLDMLVVVLVHVDDSDSRLRFALAMILFCFFAFDALHAFSITIGLFVSSICLRSSSSRAAGHALAAINLSSSVNSSHAVAFFLMSSSMR